MNLDQVFAKTREGEEAVHQRTRLVQRNLRTVLILIDGKSTVEELVTRAGSKDVFIAALEQLERDGFIRVVSSSSQPPAPASNTMDNYLEPATDESFPSMPVAGGANAPFSSAASNVSINPFGPQSVVVSSFSPTPSVTLAKLDAISVSPFSSAAPAPPKSVANPFQSVAEPPEPANPFGAPTSAAGAASFGAKPTAIPEDKVDDWGAPIAPLEPLASKPERIRGPVFTKKRMTIGAGTLVVALGLTVVFYPYDNYRPKAEKALAQMTGQPVTIGNISASFAPLPMLVMSQVSIGAGAEGGGLTIAEVRARPTFGSLFSSKKSFSRVTLSGTQVPMAQVGLLASGLSAAGQSEVFSVERLDIDRMTLALRDVSFQDYSGRAELSPDGGLTNMTLKSKDGTMSISVAPGAGDKGGAQVSVQGQGWRSAEGSPYVFDSLAINGQLSGTKFIAEKIEGRIFGGVIQGQMQVDWGSGMILSGDVNVEYMSAPSLGAALGSGSIVVEGQASARVRFRASGESWNAIANKIPLEGSFLAKSGVINGLDFVEAVRRGSQLATRGGATRYEQIVGKFRWDGGALQLSEIDLTSGVVRATGAVAVRGGGLNGSATVVLQSSAATMRMPVAIVGTLKDPQLFGGRN